MPFYTSWTNRPQQALRRRQLSRKRVTGSGKKHEHHTSMIQAPCKYGASMRPAPTQHKASTVSESDFDVSRTKMTASRFFDDDHRGPSSPYRSVIFQKATREKPSKIKAFTYASDKYHASTRQVREKHHTSPAGTLLPITYYRLPITFHR